MDLVLTSEGYTLLEPLERCLLAVEGYRELGLLDEARRELHECDDHVRAEWEAMSEAERESRERWAAERLPTLEKVLGWDNAPNP